MAEQTRELQAMNRPTSRTGYDDDGGAQTGADDEATIPLTKEDLERENIGWNLLLRNRAFEAGLAPDHDMSSCCCVAVFCIANGVGLHARL